MSHELKYFRKKETLVAGHHFEFNFCRALSANEAFLSLSNGGQTLCDLMHRVRHDHYARYSGTQR